MEPTGMPVCANIGRAKAKIVTAMIPINNLRFIS
jgi:hypothetical protein